MPQVYNLAQSFFVDSEAVAGAKTVDITAIDLFFKQKPNITGNKSGINNPGITVIITDTTPERRPDILSYVNGKSKYPTARLEYTDIATSTNATRASRVRFSTPIKIETNKEYAFVLSYDGNEDFSLWTSRQGETLIGSTTVSPGPSGKYVGNYYTSLTVNLSSNTSPTSSIIDNSIDWKFISDTDLKFSVFVARYAINSVPIALSSLPANTPVFSSSVIIGGGTANVTYTSNTTTYKIATGFYEYVVYDRKSSKIDVRGGEYVYQNTVFYPGGAANGLSVSITKGSDLITANNNLPNGQSFNWSSVYNANTGNEFIVLISQNDPSAGKRRTNIRRVISIESNTVIKLDSPADFTNSAAYFIKSPVGRVDLMNLTKTFDPIFKAENLEKKRTIQNLLVLSDSNANATNRFVNNTINSVSITAGGTSYSNSDYITITGFENNSQVKGGYVAVANLTTNSTGGITAVYLSNVGAGFVNTANITFTISNNTGGSTSGSAANLAFTTGAMLRSEFNGSDGTGGYFNNARIINVEVSEIIPAISINNPIGTTFDVYYSNPYYAVQSSNTFLGIAYYMTGNYDANRIKVDPLETNRLKFKNTSINPSKSNEFVIIDDSTGNPNTTSPPAGTGTLEIVTTSNNDFVEIQPTDISIVHNKFSINNDYFGENTNYGNADAKHITSKINFANDRYAEDLLVYLVAYRPLNTDIKVYARLHNSNDPEAFDDKDWTLLSLKSPDIYSSSAIDNDYIEMEFGLNKYPNTYATLAGYATIANTSTVNVVGVATTFSTNTSVNLRVNDLVKIYSPLFPNTYSISVVSAVANDTQFSITTPITNNDLIVNSLKIDLIGRVGNTTVNAVGYPLQAFNNGLNDNVATYYNSSMVKFETYNSMQFKIVLLSDISSVNSTSSTLIPTTVPRVDSIQAVGVTA